MRVSELVSLCLFLVATACAHAGPPGPRLRAVDTFGTTRVSPDEIRADYGDKLEAVAGLRAEQKYDESFRITAAIENELKTRLRFPFVKISLITYFGPTAFGDYATVDFVEPADALRRLDFAQAPRGKFTDPDNLLALWEKYFEVGSELQRAGNFRYPLTCPVWHCVFGFEDPSLIPFLAQFNARVPRHEKELARILREDSRPNFRAGAAFLLAHTKNGDRLVKKMLSASNDPAALVRNNAMRVLAAITRAHPEVEVPVGPLLRMLNYPEATDRNKAGFALAPLAEKEANAGIILKKAGGILLAMLKLEQPNNHDPAFLILKNLSGENYGERDYDAWEGWLKSRRMK